MSAPRTPLAERLARRIAKDPATGCHNWIGVPNEHGYGKIGAQAPDRRKLLAHRAAYELAVGPVPKGLELDHLCRNRLCCNPVHLEAVTHRENILRSQNFVAVAAAKTHCLRGHPFSVENTRLRANGTRGCKACDALLHRQRGLKRSQP